MRVALNDSLAVRRLRILDFDFHRVTTKAHSIRGDVFRGGVHSDAASFDIEVRRVPWTLDFLADDLPFGEWAAFVRTVVINRVDLAIEVYEREMLALHLNADRTVFGNLRLLRDFDESRHVLDPIECRHLFWECGVVGHLRYLEAEAARVRPTGIGCLFDDETHELVGIGDERRQTFCHFTTGGPVDDAQASILPA